VTALDAGADYVTKPFGIDELLARLRAVSRRTTRNGEASDVRIGTYTIDLASKRVAPADESNADPHRIRPATRSDSPPPNDTSSKSSSGTRANSSAKTAPGPGLGPGYTHEFHHLQEYLARLRRKLETDPARPRHLLTEPGMGYRYQP